MTVRKRYYRQGKLGPLYPGHGVGKAGAGTSAKDSPVCAGIRKRVCTLYGEKSAADRRKEISAKRRELLQAQRRIEELDRLFQRLYEDNVSGKSLMNGLQSCPAAMKPNRKIYRKRLLSCKRN